MWPPSGLALVSAPTPGDTATVAPRAMPSVMMHRLENAFGFFIDLASRARAIISRGRRLGGAGHLTQQPGLFGGERKPAALALHPESGRGRDASVEPAVEGERRQI